MYTTVNERFRMIAEKLYNGNITAMAKATYISRTTINSIIGENEVAPGYEVIRKIAEISSPKISLDWLITGAGEMLVDTMRQDKNISPLGIADTFTFLFHKVSFLSISGSRTDCPSAGLPACCIIRATQPL